MAAPSPKQRTIAHMNTDHADSLEDYLKFYNGIDAVPGTAKMVDLNLDSMKIEYRDQTGVDAFAIVKISPPMSSLAESRVKLVAMTEEASGKKFHKTSGGQTEGSRQKTPIKWTLPELSGLLTLVSTAFGFWSLSHDYPLSRGGPMEPYLFTPLITVGRNFRRQFLALMIAIHVIEALVVARICWKNGVP